MMEFILIAGGFGMTYIIVNGGIFGTRIKEKKFLKEKCFEGGKHEIIYLPWGITYQQMKCAKCKKSVIINQ